MRSLKDLGHRIIYIDVTNGSIIDIVGKQGFEVEPIGFDHFPKPDVRKLAQFNIYGKIKKHFNYLSRIDKWILEEEIYDEIIDRIKPDLLILDTHYTIDAILLSKYKIPMFFYTLFVPMTKAFNVPVCTSSMIPNDSKWSHWKSRWTWIRHRVRLFLENEIYIKFFSVSFEERLRIYSLTSLLAQKNKFPLSEVIEFNKAFHIGFNNLPEIVAIPKEFDFPRDKHPNQINIGSVVDLNRYEKMPDNELRFKESLKTESGQVLIYCSLGTLAAIQYGNPLHFFRKVIEAFGSNNKYRLILSVGDKLTENDFENVPENIFIFQRVPQLQVLRHANMMITHGGISSIVECILLGVPMLVYPLSNRFDQPGNAARVVFHKIGLRGKINYDNCKKIKKKSDSILFDLSYKTNIENMKSAITTNNDFNDGIDLIKSALTQRLSSIY
jgi:MGT family glycosyltransferase